MSPKAELIQIGFGLAKPRTDDFAETGKFKARLKEEEKMMTLC